jgi:hypothetical protein
VISTSVLVSAVAALVLVGGCSTRTPGSAVADPVATGPGSAAPGSSNNYGAPKVTTPLDTTRYQHTPCSTLTSPQQHALGITTPGKATDDSLGGICDWNLASGIAYTVGFNVRYAAGDARGIANAYEIGGADMTPLPDISGQPAVTEPSQNVDHGCTIYLGATDEIEYVVTVDEQLDIDPKTGARLPGGDACAAATQVAGYATTTMRSGS